MSTLDHDEKHIININNNNTVFISIIIITIILILIIFLYNLISSTNIKNGKHSGVEYKVYITSFIIIFNILFFQINFYFFVHEYKYLGNIGTDEMIVHILNNIKI